MAKYKVRRPALATGGFQIGANGTSASLLMFGSASAAVPQLTASGTTVSACFTISNLPATALIFFTGGVTCPSVFVTAASVISASLVAASFAAANHAATGGACTMYFNYIAVA